MSPSAQEPEATQILEVSWTDRWEVYKRLQELEIPCWCQPNRPLRVQINSAIAAVQVQSVLRQLNAPRQDLVQWLGHCWHQEA